MLVVPFRGCLEGRELLGTRVDSQCDYTMIHLMPFGATQVTQRRTLGEGERFEEERSGD
jgi:hypothetical protein